MATKIQVCDIDPSLEEVMKKFKFRKEKNVAALVLKINKDKQTVVLDEEYEDVSIDDLQNELPASQPRYILLSYVFKRDDGRESYPLCFIFVSPQGCQPDLTMMYAGTMKAVVDKAQVTKVFEVRSVEELTEDFIKEQLSFFR
ncbi:glia maturation factor gamma-like [Pomacea canaliculata]|uniref:glia maturation factor gamma-like n=1 Tax=Pomacea canaliculata TaxID=400727 RepID=UPI000D735E89|nr:glia maturation factor gamma-like [Pomacea canaliculata]